MKGVCFGSCIAQNYYRRRNLWAPFWFCEEACAQGLFPGMRLASRPGCGRSVEQRGAPEAASASRQAAG